MLFVLLLVLRLYGRGGNRRWEKAISCLSAVREGVCVWDIQHRGFITEHGLSSKQAWRILYLEREKEHSCPDYHVEVFFALAFLEVSTALLRCDTATEPSVHIL